MVQTVTRCPECPSKAVFYVKPEDAESQLIRLTCPKQEDADAGCGLDRLARVVEYMGMLPEPAWTEFLLRCQRNYWVLEMGRVPRAETVIDDPCGPGATRYNRCSYEIGMLDSKLFRAGYEV